MRWLEQPAKRLFLKAADSIRFGSIDIVCPDRTYSFQGRGPGASAMMCIHDERVFRRAFQYGDRGLGEAYLDGDWTSPDLVALLRLALRNNHAFTRLNGPLAWAARQTSRVTHRLRANTRDGSRANIAAHYDLGNEFFSLILD